MQIKLINRRDNKQYWLSKYNTLTYDYEQAYTSNDITFIMSYILKYKKAFRAIVLTNEGEVIKKYD